MLENLESLLIDVSFKLLVTPALSQRTHEKNNAGVPEIVVNPSIDN